GSYWAQVYGYQITTQSFPFSTGGIASSDRFVDLATGLFPVIDIRWYGAVGDGLQQNNCSMSIGTFNVTCSDVFGRTFVPTDVGKLAGITGAGTPDSFQSPLITTIAAYIGPHTVTLASAAIQSTSTQTITYGTDNASAYCAATECTQPLYTGIYGSGVLSGREVYAPGGNYVSSQPFYLRDNMILRGDGPGTQFSLLSLVNTIDIANNPLTWTVNTYNPVVCVGNAAAGANTCQNDNQALGATGAVAVYDILVSSITQTPGILMISNNGPCCQNTLSTRGVWAEGYNRLMTIRAAGVNDEAGVQDGGVV